MLKESILGKAYGVWLKSAVLALLRRIWHALGAAARGSRLLHILFGPDRADEIYSRTLFARAFRRFFDALLWLLRGLVSLSRGSVLRPLLGPAVRASRLFRYEVLASLFCAVMFVVPHEWWNNFHCVIAGVVFLIAYLFRCAAGRREFVYPDVMGPGFALFFIACLLSLVFTTDILDSTRILVLFLGAFAMCWMVAVNFDEPRALRTLMGFLYFSMLIVSIYGIMQRVLGLVQVNRFITDMELNKGVPGRIYSTLDNPNNLSGFIQLFLPMGAAFAAAREKGWKRRALGLGLLFPVVAMVMTYSRAGWLSVMLAAAVFVYYHEKKVVPALLVFLLLALPLLPQSVLTRLDTITDTRDTSRSHRLAIWEGVLNLLTDKCYWITGIGLGPNTFKNVYPDYAVYIGRYGAYQSQMLYLELDLELGILGFLSFFWMTFKFAGRLVRAIRAGGGGRENRLALVAVLASLMGLAVSSVAEYLWFYQRLIYGYFIYYGAGLAALRIAERKEAGADAEGIPEG